MVLTSRARCAVLAVADLPEDHLLLLVADNGDAVGLACEDVVPAPGQS
jgi:hypothetical protein